MFLRNAYVRASTRQQISERSVRQSTLYNAWNDTLYNAWNDTLYNTWNDTSSPCGRDPSVPVRHFVPSTGIKNQALIVPLNSAFVDKV